MKKIGKPELSLVAVVVLLIVIEQIMVRHPGLLEWNQRIYASWTGWAIRYGYLGAFIVSFIGNVNLVLVFPYTIVIFLLAASGLNPILLGIATGTGAVIGEFSGYIMGRWGSAMLERKRPGMGDSLKLLLQRRPKLIPVLLYVVTLLPVPADILFIPLGLLKYHPWQVFWPSLLGKVSAGIIIAYSGNAFFHVIGTESTTVNLPLEFLTLGALAVLMYALVKTPWERIIERFAEHETHS